MIDPRGRRLFTRVLNEPPEVLAHVLPFGNPIAHGTVMYRRDDVLAVGGYDESIIGSYDYDLWLRLAARGRFVSLPMVCTRYRWHDGQTTRRQAAPTRAHSVANSLRVLASVLGGDPDPSAVDAAARVWRETGELCDLAAADHLYREALQRVPQRFRRRIEQLTAEHFVGHASRLALAWHPFAAANSLRYAARWDPRGVASLTVRRIAWLAAVRWRERT